MTGDILVRIDFELLYEQRKAVLSCCFSNTLIPTDVIEGIIGVLDSMLDAAEEECEYSCRMRKPEREG